MVDATGHVDVRQDLSARLRITTFRGPIDDTTLLGALDALVHAEDFDPGLDDLIDLRGGESWHVTRSGLSHLIDRLRELDALGHRTRTAIVVGSDLVYGLSRMYELMRGATDGSTEEVRVFRDELEAHRWLGRGER